MKIPVLLPNIFNHPFTYESDKKIEVEVIEEILDIGKKMLIEPVKILPDVITTLEYLSKNYILILITKGDLYDQEKKIANSNLSKYFDFLEIKLFHKKTIYYSQIT